MEDLRLHFPGQQRPDQALGDGVHALDGAGLPTSDGGRSALSLHRDHRGLWLRVEDGVRGVHVNGRPVRRLALLRPGDQLHMAGIDMLLVGTVHAPASRGDTGPDAPVDVRNVLRAHSGRHHGRSFVLDHPRLISTTEGADIPVDSAPDQDVQVAITEAAGVLILRAITPGDGVRVNGVVVREAVLVAGDHVVCAGGNRFVMEGASPSRPTQARTTVPEPAPHAIGGGGTLPWLLITAALIGLALAALLLR